MIFVYGVSHGSVEIRHITIHTGPLSLINFDFSSKFHSSNYSINHKVLEWTFPAEVKKDEVMKLLIVTDRSQLPCLVIRNAL